MSVELADSYDAIFRKGVKDIAAGRLPSAIEGMRRIFNRLSRLKPETLERDAYAKDILLNAWYYLVESLRWERQLDQAMEVCEQMIERQPQLTIPYLVVPSIMVDQGRVEEGLSRLRQMAENESSVDAWSALGAEYLFLKQYDQAESAFYTAMACAQDNQDSVEIQKSLMDMYKEMGRAQDAVDAWNMILVLDPDQSDNSGQILRWLIDHGELGLAAEVLRQEADPIRHHFYRGLMDWVSGRPQQARQQWQWVCQKHPQDLPISWPVPEWIEAALRLGRAQDAFQMGRESMQQGVQFGVNEFLLMACACAMLGETLKMKSYLDSVLTTFKQRRSSVSHIPAEKWNLVTDIISDKQILDTLWPYFEHA